MFVAVDAAENHPFTVDFISTCLKPMRCGTYCPCKETTRSYRWGDSAVHCSGFFTGILSSVVPSLVTSACDVATTCFLSSNTFAESVLEPIVLILSLSPASRYEESRYV